MNNKFPKITVVGIGYVGLSISILLAQKNHVIAFDISQKKIENLNKKISPIRDPDIEKFLSSKKLNLFATSNPDIAYSNSEIIIVCTPTDYDELNNSFNLKSIEKVIKQSLKYNLKPLIVIKSTIPIGYISALREKFNYKNIIFSPEFLREGLALHDNLYPSRIIVGEKSKKAMAFAELLKSCAKKRDIEILLTSPNEAESIKLFSNTYLAMRVAFFNELDSFSLQNKLCSESIIRGVCMDSRIGNFYNNPSFGYGGYCLPKDTKQLLNSFKNTPQNLMRAIVDSNDTRKKFIASEIIKKKPKTVGLYRLIMKFNSDNFRSSSILDILSIIANNGIDVIIFEPAFEGKIIKGAKIVNDLVFFKANSDIILANRKSSELIDVKEKLFSRDLFNSD